VLTFATDSVTRSPLYSLYGETIAGVGVLRAFGAPSKFMRDMLRCVDTVRAVVLLHHRTVTHSATRTPTRISGCGGVSTILQSSTARTTTHNCIVNRWISSRFNVLSNFAIGCVAFIAVFSFMDAALAGFALAFASTITNDLLFMVRRFVGLEQAMVRHQFNLYVPPPPHSPAFKVAVERVKEYSELEREPPEFVEPRPPASWPTTGRIECKDLVIRYSVRFHRNNPLMKATADELFILNSSPSCQMCFMVLHSRLTPGRR